MFSIIIPSYNRNAEINALLESLEHQTIKNFEVIIVDDCSENPIKTHRTFDFSVQVLRNQQNSGPAYSRNQGAMAAQYEWLLFLDDDDRFEHNKCALLTEIITQKPDYNFIYHPAKCEMVNQNFSYITRPLPADKLNIDNILLANKVGGMPMMCIKKTFYQQLGGLDSTLKSLEDYDFVLKLVSHPELKPYFVEQPLTICAFYTKRSSVSTHQKNTEQAIEIIKQRYVHTEQQRKNFAINALYMQAYPYVMKLSRKSGYYYWQIFKLTHSVKHLFITMICFISPSLAINLKRFI